MLAFILPLLMVYAWWGGFNSVRIEQGERGPYTYAYLEHNGKLSKLPDTHRYRVRARPARYVPNETRPTTHIP